MAKLPALVIDITENTSSSFVTYKIQIKQQRHIGTEFNKGSRVFRASNGFSLRSVDRAEVREQNAPENPRCDNRLYVQGSWGRGDNRVVTAYPLSYVEQLKVAITEYNEYIMNI